MINIAYKSINFLRRTTQRALNMSSLGVRAMIINPQQEILLVKHTYLEGWHLPGGGVNRGETPKEAILREVHEEAAIKVLSEPTLFHIYTHKIYGAADFPILYIIREFELLAHKPDACEIVSTEWFHCQNLPCDITESTKSRIQEVLFNRPIVDKW